MQGQSRPPAYSGASSEPDSDSFVRIDIRVADLEGVPTGTYLFRLTSEGKTKSTTAKNVTRGGAAAAFSEKLRLYSKLNSKGQVVDNPAARPTLSLVRADSSEEVLISTVPIKLSELFQGRSGENARLALGNGIRTTLNLTVKEMGGRSGSAFSGLASSPSTQTPEDDFSDLEIPGSNPSTPSTSQVVSGGVLEGIGQQSTTSFERGGPSVIDHDARALKQKVDRLELEKKRLQKDRADAVKKVQAHVAHAAKIKTTYNQLAAMYNSLRQEHVELRKSHPRISGGSLKEMSVASMDSEDGEAKQLKEENETLRNELQTLKSEKEEVSQKSRGIVETKAKTLADLEMKWRETQSDLKTTKENLRAEQERSEELRKELDGVRNSVGDSQGLQYRIEKLVREKDELAKSHEAELSQINRDVADKGLQISRLQTAAENAFRTQEESRKELDSLKASLSEAEGKLAVNGENHTRELSNKDTELETIRAEMVQMKAAVESKQGKSSELEAKSRQLQEDLEMARKQADDIGKALHHARAELNEKDKLLGRARSRSGRRSNSSRSRGSTDSFGSERNTEVEELKEERDNAIKELFKVRKTLNKELRELRKKIDHGQEAKERSLIDASTEESLNARIASLAAENRTIASKLRRTEEESSSYKTQVETVNARTVSDDTALKTKLETLEQSLGSKIEEVEVLKKEALVLKRQRDEARLELKNATESQKGKEDELLEQVSRLENEIQAGKASSTRMEQDRGALSTSITSLESELAEVGLREKELVREAENLQKLLTEKNTQLESQVSQISTLEVQVSTLSQQKESNSQALREFRESTGAEVAELRTEINALRAKLKSAETEIVSLEELRASADEQSTALIERSDRLKQEKEKKDVEVGRLAAELSSLKESLSHASHTSTTVEKQLSETQARLAERNAEVSARQMELTSKTEELESTKTLLEDVKLRLQSESRNAQAVERLEELLKTSKDSLASEKRLRVAKESQIIEYESSLDALRSESKTLNAKIAAVSGQLHGETVHRQEAEETSKRLDATLKDTDDRHRALEGELMDLKRGLEMERNEKENMSVRLEHMTSDLERRQRELATAKESLGVDVRERDESMSLLEGEVDTLKTSLREGERMRRALEERCNALEFDAQEAEELRQRLSAKEGEFAKLTKLLGALKDENEKTLSDYEVLREQNRSMKRELGNVENLSRSVEEERDRMTSDSQNVRRELQRVIEEKEVLASTVEDLQKSLEKSEKDKYRATELRKELRAARGRAEMLEADVANVKAENRELSSRAEAAQALEDANGEMDGIVEDLVKAKLRLAEAHEENDALKFRLNKLEAMSHANEGSSSFERRGSSSFERKNSSEKRKRGLLR